MADWFVVNVRDGHWRTHHAFGASCGFEDSETPFEQFGINVRVLQPGQPNCLYHSESNQEDFLVLAGECLLLVDGQLARQVHGSWSDLNPLHSSRAAESRRKCQARVGRGFGTSRPR